LNKKQLNELENKVAELDNEINLCYLIIERLTNILMNKNIIIEEELNINLPSKTFKEKIFKRKYL